MKKVTIILLAVMFFVSFIGVEMATVFVDNENRVIEIEKDIYVIRARKNDTDDIFRKIRKIFGDTTEELYATSIKGDDNGVLLRIVEGANGIGKTENEKLINVVFE